MCLGVCLNVTLVRSQKYHLLMSIHAIELCILCDKKQNTELQLDGTGLCELLDLSQKVQGNLFCNHVDEFLKRLSEAKLIWKISGHLPGSFAVKTVTGKGKYGLGSSCLYALCCLWHCFSEPYCCPLHLPVHILFKPDCCVC